MNVSDSVHPVQRAAHAYVGAFVDELARAGLRHVCICPGSRSTPLALLCTEHERLRVWTHIDERSAAFFALGLAKATGEPVALIATSGTAVANFLPAVTEAFFARVPLLLLTADRPHELRDMGSNQTIFQAGIFGPHVKWCVDMPVPELGETMVRHARTTAGRAFAFARSAPAGPVQLNFPLREPLIPLPGGEGTVGEPTRRPTERDGEQPYVDVVQGARVLSDDAIDALTDELTDSRRLLFIAGPDLPPDAVQPIAALAARLGSPLLADPLSGLRTTGDVSAQIIDAYDTFLRVEQVVAAVPPSLIVRFGAMPVSKSLLLYLQQYADVPQIVVDEGDGWRDPAATAARVLHVDAARLCQSVVQALDREENATGGANLWSNVWRRLNDVTREQLQRWLQQLDEPFEGHVFDMLTNVSLDGVNVYVGNSMPIRDFDTFFPAVAQRVRVFGNRGVSGIDGIVSGALGVSAANDGPVLLVLGDLSFYHDLNGLLAAKLHALDATIVVINNDGGGIFSFLPQAQHPQHFETLFGTPIGLDFSPVVGMYGGIFVKADDVTTLQETVASSLEQPGLHVIEFVTERGRNAELHRQLFAAVGEELTNSLGAIFRSASSGR